MRTIGAFLLCCALSGCGLLFQNLTPESGYQVRALDAKTYTISVEVDDPKEESARDYFVRRAQHVADEKRCSGYDVVDLSSYSSKTTLFTEEEAQVTQRMIIRGTIRCHG